MVKFMIFSLLFTIATCKLLRNDVHSSFYSEDKARASLKLSSIGYCNLTYYLDSNVFDAAVSGFIPTKIFYNASFDIAGYIGFLPQNKSIYVVFRGTVSDPNRQIDYEYKLVPYEKWPSCECRVHSGF